MENEDVSPIVAAIDIETSSLKPQDGVIRLISYADDNKCFATEDIDSLRAILEDEKILKVFHNALFDVVWLRSKGYQVCNYTDTFVMSLIINNKVSRGNKLADLSEKYLGYSMDKSYQNESNWQGSITNEHIKYARLDAFVTYKLYWALKVKIDEMFLGHVLDREIRALPAVVEMTLNGVKFNINAWGKLLFEDLKQSKTLETDIYSSFGVNEMNINSAKQLKSALHKKGIMVNSTRKEELKLYNSHQVVEDVLTYKKLRKGINTYGLSLKECLTKEDIFHSNWRSIGANTFRMSCNKPNLQGLPRKGRKFFLPRSGNVFVLADYSQIELRMLAFMSQDDNMIKAFKEGIDLHSYTGAMILNKPIDEVSDDERQIAKATNFGISYGMTPYGLRRKILSDYKIDVGLSGAQSFIDGFYSSYPKVLKFHDHLLSSEVIQTVGGRKWDSKDLKKGHRKRLNYPVQGSAAEGLKIALHTIYTNKPVNWLLVAAIHDEIILEVPKSEANIAKDFLEKSMIGAMSTIIKDIPVEVDALVSNSWAK